MKPADMAEPFMKIENNGVSSEEDTVDYNSSDFGADDVVKSKSRAEVEDLSQSNLETDSDKNESDSWQSDSKNCDENDKDSESEEVGFLF